MKRLARTACCWLVCTRPHQFVRLEIAARRNRAAARALGALVAAHRRGPAALFDLERQVPADARDFHDWRCHAARHFFFSEPASTDSFTAPTLRYTSCGALTTPSTVSNSCTGCRRGARSPPGRGGSAANPYR